jgi:hypothetical protein
MEKNRALLFVELKKALTGTGFDQQPIQYTLLLRLHSGTMDLIRKRNKDVPAPDAVSLAIYLVHLLALMAITDLDDVFVKVRIQPFPGALIVIFSYHQCIIYAIIGQRYDIPFIGRIRIQGVVIHQGSFVCLFNKVLKYYCAKPSVKGWINLMAIYTKIEDTNFPV